MDPDFRLWVWHFSITELFPYSFYQKWESGPQKQRSNISALWVFLSTTKFRYPPIFTINTCLLRSSRLLLYEQHTNMQVTVLLTTRVRSSWKGKHLLLENFFKLDKMWAFIRKDFEAGLCGLLHKLLVMFEGNTFKLFSQHVNLALKSWLNFLSLFKY